VAVGRNCSKKGEGENDLKVTPGRALRRKLETNREAGCSAIIDKAKGTKQNVLRVNPSAAPF